MSVAPTLPFAVVALLVGIAIALLWQRRCARRQSKRIHDLIDFLENASLGNAGLLASTGEDDLARLQDEISKTVTTLERTRKQAIDAREDYALNLSNIAHQIKTPLTVLSLASQRLHRAASPVAPGTPNATPDFDPAIATSDVEAALAVIDAQLERLTRLQSDLLLMAKLDAGALTMNPQQHDLYTLLAMAAESLKTLALERNVKVKLQEEATEGPADEAVTVTVDEHWTVEALSNLVKNCIEHAPRGSVVTMAYGANPLYAFVLISDCGGGFSAEDAHHLFERFYTSGSQSHGTGLGLPFARELIEAQGGTIEARNLPEGGACFDVRFYVRHPVVTFAP